MPDQPRPLSARTAVLLACIPFVPFLVALMTHLPLQRDDVVPLTGRWDLVRIDGQARPGDVPATVQLPGHLPRLSRDVQLHKTISLSHIVDEPQLLVFGGVSNGVASLQLNGVWIGDEGVPERGYKLERVGLAAYAVSPSLLRAGDNDLVVTIVPAESPLVALVDARVLLGPSSVVRPWFDRTVIGKRLLETGGIPLLFAIIALAFGLSRIERDDAMKKVQLAACGMSVGVLLYLAGTSGLVGGFGGTGGWVALSVATIALFLPELAERACRGETTRFVTINRVVCITDIVLQLALHDAVIYLAFIPWLLLDIGWSAALAARALTRRPSAGLFALCMSVLAMAAAGVNDLLTDLGVITTPRLFTLAAIDMAVIGAAFLVERFVHTTRDNEALLVDVESKNVHLQHALARAEESTRLKSAFLANTSHELRTPLNSIINVPEGLLQEFRSHDVIACASCQEAFARPDDFVATPGLRCPACDAVDTLQPDARVLFDGDAAAAQRLLRAVQTSGRHLLAVVNDILDLSRLEAGQMTVQLQRVALGPLFVQLHTQLAPLAQAQGVELRVEGLTPADDVEDVQTDPTRLVQILVNLVGNAIKFSPPGSRVAMQLARSTDTLAIRVVDNGIGIAPVHQARIFDAFVQVDDSHTKAAGGTGLGLAITRQLVTLLQGTIDVDSAPGRGSTFTVRLPRVPVPSS